MAVGVKLTAMTTASATPDINNIKYFIMSYMMIKFYSHFETVTVSVWQH